VGRASHMLFEPHFGQIRALVGVAASSETPQISRASAATKTFQVSGAIYSNLSLRATSFAATAVISFFLRS